MFNNKNIDVLEESDLETILSNYDSFQKMVNAVETQDYLECQKLSNNDNNLTQEDKNMLSFASKRFEEISQKKLDVEAIARQWEKLQEWVNSI